MQCHSLNPQFPELANLPDVLNQEDTSPQRVGNQRVGNQPFEFQAKFAGLMQMYSDGETVANYLAGHEKWFSDCAKPMKVEKISDNGYLLILGNFGALGYEVEVKVALVIEPSNMGQYRMYSVPSTAVSSLPYEVDYQAQLELREIPSIYLELGQSSVSVPVTEVVWDLQLNISVKLPRFIQKLPVSLIQKSGNRLLSQIVKQVSPRLTQRVQKDFHSRFNLPLPPKNSAKLRCI